MSQKLLVAQISVHFFPPLLFWSYFFVLHVTVLVCSAYGELYQLGWRLSLRLHWQMLNADEHSHFAL